MQKINIEALDYPALHTLPEYLEESHKLTRFNSALADAEAEADRMACAWLELQEKRAGQDEAAGIAEAESLLSGTPLQSDAEQIERNRVVITSLRRAIKAQSAVVERVRDTLSVKAAQRFEAEHKARTQRVANAVAELAAANASELALRASVEVLGYWQKLPCMRFEVPGCLIDPQDENGGYTVAWLASAGEYAQTAEQKQDKALEVRRRKLATLST